MNSSIPDRPERHDFDDRFLGTDPLAPVSDPLTPVDEPIDEVMVGRTNVAAVQTVVTVPMAVPVPVEPGQPWTGTVIDAIPTTADEIAALVLSVPDVVRLHAGRFGEVATYLPGRRVTGVKLGDDQVEVHVVIAGQAPVQQTAQAIHQAVATLIATPVHVFIEDLAAG